MTNKTTKNRLFLSLFLQNTGIYLAVALLISVSVISIVPKVFAASSMTQSSVLETNMNTSTGSSFYVDFKAGAADGAGSLTITWPAGFTVNATQTASTGTCTSVFSGATALPGTTFSGTAGSGQVVTVGTVGALTLGTQYCVALTSATAVTNPGTANNYSVSLADGTDTTSVGIDVISSDQITVTASIGQTFTLSFGSNTDALGNLSYTGLTTSGGVALTVTTNAVNGWGLWAEDSSAGLHSTNASKTIATVSTGSNHTMNGGTIGTEAYALGVTTANATTNYADAGGITGGGLSTSAFNEIASANTSGSAIGVTVKELADVANTTAPATDYGDTITIVGDGSF